MTLDQQQEAYAYMTTTVFNARLRAPNPEVQVVEARLNGACRTLDHLSRLFEAGELNFRVMMPGRNPSMTYLKGRDLVFDYDFVERIKNRLGDFDITEYLDSRR